jgi:hypothetical protein
LPTHNPKISIAQIQEMDFQTITRTIEKILGSLYKLPEEKLVEKMQEIVPGYRKQVEVLDI